MSVNGSLNTCRYCELPLQVVEGTDPNESRDSFWEKYECDNGHVGRYEFTPTEEKFYGACARHD